LHLWTPQNKQLPSRSLRRSIAGQSNRGAGLLDGLNNWDWDMKDYVLKQKSEPASNDIIWAFDFGKGSIGEAVRQGTNFLHKASLLIPAEFAETKTARDRRRMNRTREAHKAREKLSYN
jgi:hypothetical protein